MTHKQTAIVYVYIILLFSIFFFFIVLCFNFMRIYQMLDALRYLNTNKNDNSSFYTTDFDRMVRNPSQNFSKFAMSDKPYRNTTDSDCEMLAQDLAPLFLIHMVFLFIVSIVKRNSIINNV